MNEAKAPTNARIEREKIRAVRHADSPTYRTVLVAASVGVLIGLLLKR